MVVEYMDYLVEEFMLQLFQFLGSLMITDGVSWLGLCVCVTLLVTVIGSILMRV